MLIIVEKDNYEIQRQSNFTKWSSLHTCLFSSWCKCLEKCADGYCDKATIYTATINKTRVVSDYVLQMSTAHDTYFVFTSVSEMRRLIEFFFSVL